MTLYIVTFENEIRAYRKEVNALETLAILGKNATLVITTLRD
jgi:hypothetical protein